MFVTTVCIFYSNIVNDLNGDKKKHVMMVSCISFFVGDACSFRINTFYNSTSTEVVKNTKNQYLNK